MAAACYNLKKYMKHISKKVKTIVIEMPKPAEAVLAVLFSSKNALQPSLC